MTEPAPIRRFFRSTADHNVVFNGVTLAVLLPCSAQGHALIHSHVVAHNRGFADDDSIPVIDKQAPADFRPGDGFRFR